MQELTGKTKAELSHVNPVRTFLSLTRGYKVCGIYKISFLKTSKVYIGQSVEMHERILSHLRSAFPEKYSVLDSNLPIHRAIRKYKEEIFIQVISFCSREKLDRIEKYWIKQYSSDLKEHGYNVSHGGQDSIGLTRERHSRAKLTEVQVDRIKEELQRTNFTLAEISRYLDVSVGTIVMINQGRTWRDKDKSYPLRDNKACLEAQKKLRKKKASDAAVEKIRDLSLRGLTYERISETMPEFSRSLIWNICTKKPPYDK